MTCDEFRASLTGNAPPRSLTPALRALWHDGKGDWAAAHADAQGENSPKGAWVHAYLHRKEGDVSNAGYWYRRAGQPVSGEALDAEWERIARALLAGL